ncbi:MAG: hypothetical protein C5B59_16520 [Bacteroidetes bacterium]|nr:MAG: hypothetical protein C5B59_16520 [Bacteroidota bacterium]
MAEPKRNDQLANQVSSSQILSKKFICTLGATLCVFSTFAQLHWKNVDTLYGALPPSFHVFRTSDSLHGAPFVAFYVSAALKDKNLQFNTQVSNGNPYTPDEFFELENRPLLVVNGGFFSFETGQSLSSVMRNGKQVAYSVNALKGIREDSMLYYYPTRSALGIDRKRQADVAWIFTSAEHRLPYAFESAPVIAKGKDPNPSIYELKNIGWVWWPMRTAVGGGPCLVHDGKIWVTYKEEQMFVGEENEKQPRTAMGYTKDGRLIILVIEGRHQGRAEGGTLEDEARILKSLDCYEALNLNGGGSSCMLINGKETIKPSEKTGQRPIPAVFVIKQGSRKNAK